MAFDPTTAALDTEAFNPATARPEPPAKPRGYAASFASGIPEALIGTLGKGLSLAAAAPAIGIDKLRGMVTGREETAAQDFMFRNLTDRATAAAEPYALTAEEAADPAKAILHGLGSVVPTLGAAVLTRGAIGGKELGAQTAAMLPGAAPWLLNAAQGTAMMAPAAALTGSASGARKVEQGTDLSTAFKTAAIDTAGLLVEGALPMSVTGGLVKRMASGAGINVVSGEAQRLAQNAVLGERPDLQRDASAQDMAVNAATGALFAGILGPRPIKTQIEAAKAEAKAEFDTASAEPAPAAPQQLGYSPLAGTPVVFPDGTVALGSEAALTRATAPRDAPRPQGATDLAVRYAEEARAKIAAERQRIADLRAEGAAAAAVTTPRGRVPLPPAEVSPPTAIELAMQRAQREAAFVQAEAAAQATKQIELDAIQNLTQADQLAQAAARGETPPGTVAIAKPHTEFLSAADELLREAGSPGFKQDVAKAVRGKKTLLEQIEALQKAQAGIKNQQSNRYEYLGRLIEKFSEAPEPKAISDETPSPQAPEAVAPAAQGPQPKPAVLDAEPTPGAAPVRAAEPAAVDPIARAVEVLKTSYGDDAAATRAAQDLQGRADEASPTGRADPEVVERMAVDDVLSRTAQPEGTAEALAPRNNLLDPQRDAALAEARDARATLQSLADEYATRLQAREELPETEHARYERADELRRAIEDATREDATPASAERLKDLASFSKDFATPEAWAKAKGEWLAARASTPDQLSKSLMVLTDEPRPLNEILTHLEDTGSEPWVRELAGKLRAFDLPTTVDKGAMPEGMPKGTVAVANADIGRIIVTDSGATESTMLHEAVHAATQHTIERARTMGVPANQADAKIKQAYDGLDAIRKDALRRATADQQYGLTDVDEFMAELHTNPGFQKFLNEKGLWQRVVEAIRKLLGMTVEERPALERAMEFQKDIFNTQAYKETQRARQAALDFASSYQGAEKAVDSTLAKVVQTVDDESRWLTFGRATARATMQKLLAWETKQYIADRTAAVPEFRAAGFADAARAMYQAGLSRTYAGNYTQRVVADFTGKLHKALHAIPDGAERKRANDMAGKVATGASIGGFDPTLNFKDNLAQRPTLDVRREAHINQTHRDFVALQRAHPALAEAIVEGAKANRHDFVLTTATVVDNLLAHAARSQQKLEAELTRMDPAQAAAVRARIGSADTAKTDSAFASLYAGKLDFMAKDVQNAKTPTGSRFPDSASAELHARLSEVFRQAEQLPEGNLRSQLSEMKRAYDQQFDNDYYHAGRSGDYFVNVGFKDMDAATWAKMGGALEGTGRALGDYTDQDHIFMKVESLDQAAALRRKLVAAGGDKIDTARNRHGKWAEEYRLDNNSGISSAMRSVLDTVHESVGEIGLEPAQAAVMREVISRKFLSMLPETSVRTAKLHRVGVPGYDTDFLGTFAKHAAASTRDTANIYTMRAFSQAIEGLTEGVARLSEAPDGEFQARGQMIRDELLKRYNNSLTHVDNKHVDLINSLGHSFYLAMSPAYLIRSMAQPYHRGLPYLGSRYGFVSSAKEIGAATGTAMKLMSRAIRDGWKDDGIAGMVDAGMKFDDLGLTAREMDFMREMQDRGVFDLGQARQLQRMAIDGSPRTQNAVRIASMTAQWSDMVNRVAVGLAAFRLAEKGKTGLQGDQSAMAHANYADSAVKYIMDDFSPDNTARAIGKHGVFGQVTPLTTAFMNYNLQTMQQIARTVLDGMFSHDKTPAGLQRAKEARLEFAGLMGTTSMIAGVMGLPFANVFAGVYNTLFDDEDAPRDIRVEARNWLADTFGAKVGEVIAHGPLQALTGVESYTFGMQNILPGSEFLSSRRLVKDRLDELPKTLMGPALNAGLDLAAGIGKISEGAYIKGIAQMLPSGLKGYWKAGEIAEYGFTDAKGRPIPGLPATPWDIAIQATGLRPAKRAETSEAMSEVSAHQSRVNARKAAINDRIYKAYRFGEDVTGALEDAAAFNAKNPMQPIRDIAGMIRTRMTQEALGATVGGVNVPSKRLLPVYSDLTRFNQGGMP